MKTSISDERWAIYLSEPNPDNYRGFELEGTIKTKPNKAKLVFTNGEKRFEIIENSVKEAYIKGFDLIDSYLK